MANPYVVILKENQLQNINHILRAQQEATSIAGVPGHVGNPTVDQYGPSLEVAADYYEGLEKSGMGAGYEDVNGNIPLRKQAADAMTSILRLPPGDITEKNVIGTVAGTGALTIALLTFGKDSTFLVPEPTYPPWMNIANNLGLDIQKFPLHREQKFLLNYDVLKEKLEGIDNGQPIIITTHYPYNPGGKCLTEDEAKDNAAVINRLCEEYPNLQIIQEDLYLATIKPERGIYTPMPYLNDTAKSRFIEMISPSKMGHPKDRAGIIVAYDEDILEGLRGRTSATNLGFGHPSLVPVVNTLTEIATGGVDAIDHPKSKPNNYRYKVARNYQTLMGEIADGLQKIEQALGRKDILPDGCPDGTYYLYPSFEFLKGQEIPKELLPVFDGKKTFKNADDVAKALLNAHLIGLQPVTIATGTLFEDDQTNMNFRFSAVGIPNNAVNNDGTEKLPDEEGLARNVALMKSAANTLCGLAQKVMGKDCGAEFHSLRELRELYPAISNTAPNPSTRFKVGSEEDGYLTGTVRYHTPAERLAAEQRKAAIKARDAGAGAAER